MRTAAGINQGVVGQLSGSSRGSCRAALGHALRGATPQAESRLRTVAGSSLVALGQHSALVGPLTSCSWSFASAACCVHVCAFLLYRNSECHDARVAADCVLRSALTRFAAIAPLELG